MLIFWLWWGYTHTHQQTHMYPHTLLSLLHLKELIVAAHLPGLHHDCSNRRESHVGFLLNPCPACSCISLMSRWHVVALFLPGQPEGLCLCVCIPTYITHVHGPAGVDKGAWELTMLANAWGCRGQRSNVSNYIYFVFSGPIWYFWTTIDW